MAVSAAFDVIQGLVDLANSKLEGVNVRDGYGSTADQGDYLQIGIQDPESTDFSESLSAEQDWANSNGGSRSEEGDVTCSAMSWNGDVDNLAGARRSVRGVVDAFAQALLDKPTLGIDSLLWVSFGKNFNIQQAQDEDGSIVRVTFSVHYVARVNN